MIMSQDRSVGGLAVFTAGVVGGLLGAGAMYFLSPRSGKQNRALVKQKLNEFNQYVEEERAAMEEKITEIFGEVNTLTTALYRDVQRFWDAQVSTFKKSMKKIDKAGYQDMVDSVIEKLQFTQKYDDDNLSKVRRYLSSQWRKFNQLS